MKTNRVARWYVVVLVGSVVGFTAAYDAGMTVFEGRPRTALESLEVVVQTYTTTGYGQDAPWASTPMNLLVVTMQVASLVLIFSAFPAIIVPLIEDSLSTTPPAERRDVTDHVVVCHATSHTRSLIEELSERGVPYVILEPDRETAIQLYERDMAVVHGDPQSLDDLERVAVADARALVTDAEDDVDLSVVASTRELAPELPVYTVAQETEYVEYHQLAGADEVFLPRELLGRGLANKVRNTVDTEIEGGAVADEDFTIGEVAVAADSDVAGATLGDSAVREQNGAQVIGVWSGGRFHTLPCPDVTLDEQTVLLLVGREMAVESIAKRAGSSVRTYGRGAVVVAGAGVVGRTVADAVVSDGIESTVLDLEDTPRVDVVGDVTDEETLREAGVADARTVVLALDSDTVTLVAAFVIGKVAPDVEIVARADETQNVRKLYHAGVDYVLSLSTVAGRLLAAEILESEDPISLDQQIRLVRRDPGSLAGQTLGEARLREETGCAVVAVEHRDGRVTTALRDWTEIEATDHLVVAGTDDALARFDERRTT